MPLFLQIPSRLLFTFLKVESGELLMTAISIEQDMVTVLHYRSWSWLHQQNGEAEEISDGLGEGGEKSHSAPLNAAPGQMPPPPRFSPVPWAN